MTAGCDLVDLSDLSALSHVVSNSVRRVIHYWRVVVCGRKFVFLEQKLGLLAVARGAAGVVFFL